MPKRIPAPTLIAYATALLEEAGLEPDKSAGVAHILVEADLLGHSTHGLQLLPAYLGELTGGGMARSGAPTVVADAPAAVTWDGGRLPGPWLVQQGLALAAARARTQGTCTVVIRRSHHIACLAAFLKPLADAGLAAWLTCSDPRLTSVAPYGGRRGVYTPNPIAATWPTDGDPVMLDISSSITTNGLVRRCQLESRRLPGAWLLDPNGNPTDDPSVMSASPPGALMPAGGLDHGHKGYALGLFSEALTGGLAGYGRANPAEGWSANVFLQVLDPALFAGAAAFVREASWVASACRQSPPRPGMGPVRLPGEAGLARRASQLASGVDLYPGILEGLAAWAARLRVSPLPG